MAVPKRADRDSLGLTGLSSAHSFAKYLFGLDPVPQRPSELSGDDLSDAWSIAPKRRGVYNLVQVPTRLERLIGLCSCICIDEFLFLFTLLPFRCVILVLEVLKSLLCRSLAAVFPGDWRISKRLRRPRAVRVLNARGVIDAMHLSILVFTSAVLACVDISSVYHNIRGQSVIKLYVVFNVMEIFDRLFSSFGVDILDSLGWTTANAINYWSRHGEGSQYGRISSGDGEGKQNVSLRYPFRGFVLLARVAVDYLLTLVYVCLHATTLLIWVVTLNVAINTQNNALLTLLVSNNFVELKGAVFKSYKVQNLFQIACADAVERFQLTIFLGVMIVYAEGDRRLLLTWAAIFLCEVIVDWVKHAFVTKFNRIPHRAYQQFAMVICRDIVQARKNAAIRSIGGSSVAKRIGFVSLPLGALVVRMAGRALWQMPPSSVAITCATLVVLKLTLSIGLLGHGARRLGRGIDRGETDGEGSKTGDDENWYKSLMNVERYDKS